MRISLKSSRLGAPCIVGFAILGLVASLGMGMEGCQPTVIPVGPVSFSRDIQPIFNARCVSCHSPGGMADEVMHLVPEHSYDALVPSEEEHDEDQDGDHDGDHDGGMDGMDGDGGDHDMDHAARVVVGDSANSFLYQKVSMDLPPMGARMPLGGPPLSQSDIDLIKNWIEQGALNN